MRTDTISALDTIDQARQVGEGIAYRLATREQAQLEADLLTRLNQLPVSRYLTLSGSLALHGVFLHKRRNVNIDFYAPYIAIRHFRDAIQSLGVPLEPVSEPNTFVFRMPTKFLLHHHETVRLFPHEQEVYTSQTHLLTLPGQVPIPMRVPPLSELLALKLGLLSRFQRPKDYVDLWYGLHSHPNMVDEVRAVLDNTRWSSGSYAPACPFHAKVCLRRMEGLLRSWQPSLTSLVYPIPAFDSVFQDMQIWLPRLDTWGREAP